MENVTPAGKHAVEQLLLRLKYLAFEGSAKEFASSLGTAPLASDFDFDHGILEAAEGVLVGVIKSGARPRREIFDRPILRSNALRKGSSHKAPWDNHASVDAFPSALIAAQEFSFASTKVRHVDSIDDFQIANIIATSANGEKTESYNYMWSWQDTAGVIQRNLDRQGSSESFLTFKNTGLQPFATGFALDKLCGTDTTCDTTCDTACL
jgi:hypothetical protein